VKKTYACLSLQNSSPHSEINIEQTYKASMAKTYTKIQGD